MRGSTAARINNSLLPRKRSCWTFACGAVPGRGLFFLTFFGCGGAVWEKASFSGICGICRKHLRGSAIRGGLFLAFIWSLPVVPYGEEVSFPWHFWHSSHSVPERASWCTEYTFGAKNRLLLYAMRFQRHSVQKTSFWCTEWKFGTGNPLLLYRRNIRCAEQPPWVRDAFSKARCAKRSLA